MACFCCVVLVLLWLVSVVLCGLFLLCCASCVACFCCVVLVLLWLVSVVLWLVSVVLC